MATILAIDDDSDFHGYLRELLERADHVVVETGDDLRRTLAAGGIDAVITDLYMPDIDGIEILRYLRARAPSIPVICISGTALGPDDPCLRAMLALGARAVMSKPIVPTEFLTTLDRALATHD